MINDDSAFKNLIVSQNDRQDNNVSYDKEMKIVLRYVAHKGSIWSRFQKSGRISWRS